MARKVKVSAAVMNLRIHPHTEQRYVGLFRRVYSLKVPAQVHGDRYGLISTADFRLASSGVVSGVITTFTRVGTQGVWFDANNLEEASDAQLSEIRIPEGLFPNSATYFFNFNAKNHRLYVETYSRGKTITPTSVLRFLRNLFGRPPIIKEFGEVAISMVQNRAALDSMFTIDRIKKIEVELQKPNADVFSDDFEEEIEKHLLETQSRKMTVVYEADKGKSIVPTSEIRKISQAALDNGEVTVTGRHAGAAITKSSGDYPKILQETYDPDLTSEQQAFNRLIPSTDDVET